MIKYNLTRFGHITTISYSNPLYFLTSQPQPQRPYRAEFVSKKLWIHRLSQIHSIFRNFFDAKPPHWPGRSFSNLSGPDWSRRKPISAISNHFWPWFSKFRRLKSPSSAPLSNSWRRPPTWRFYELARARAPISKLKSPQTPKTPEKPFIQSVKLCQAHFEALEADFHPISIRFHSIFDL